MNNDSGESKLSRKEREFQARRQEILDAATRLFARKGYHGTAMSEIAREAEFSTGSLYNFFKNKEELYFSLLMEKIEGLERSVYALLEEDTEVEARLRKYIDVMLSYFEQERDFFRIFAEQRGQFEMAAKGEFADMIHAKLSTFLGKMIAVMERGIDEGLFKEGLTSAELAMIFSGVSNNLLTVYINSDMPFEVRGRGDLILDIFFNGTRRQGPGRMKE